MPFNKDDYTEAPFASGEMFDPATEEDLIKYVQSELKEVALSLGTEELKDEVIWGYNTYPERWDAGEWINGETASQCWGYQSIIGEPPLEEEPIVEEEQPVEEPINEPTPTE